MPEPYINNVGEKVYTDEDSKEYILDEIGNRCIPTISRVVDDTFPGWPVHDTSQGHCPFCGRLNCGTAGGSGSYCIQGGT